MQNIWKINSQNKNQINKKDRDWLVKVLAKNRGLDTPQKLKEFLNPTFEQITNANVGKTQIAVNRIEKAIKNREKIVVYSDYDADGINATAIMWETLYDLGANAMPYVPHRIKEGYGLAVDAISTLAKEKVSLIITVDHGVTAVKQIDHANKLGIDVIITDHHVLSEILPKAYCLVHTTDLCGTGVAWRLCFDLVKKLNPGYQSKLTEKLELAAIATIADLVPLTGANRAIVKIGLELLNKTKRPGIKSLLKLCRIKGPIGTYEIGHMIAPRINAMGRIEHGMDSLRLICAKNQKQADAKAELLASTNSRRQTLTTRAIESAFDIVDKSQLVGVTSHPDWHEGVIGLVASRLAETYHKPMIVISRGVSHSKGSARSIPGFNIVEAIRNSSEFLVDAGGHPMAAGFTIETRHIEAFSKKINIYAGNIITEEILAPVINIETKLDKVDISFQTLESIKQFEPYGMGNPQPIFLTENLLVEDIRTVGDANKHLKLQVGGFNAIGFNFGKLRSDLRPGYYVDLVYTMEKDNYSGRNQIQLKIKDLAINP